MGQLGVDGPGCEALTGEEPEVRRRDRVPAQLASKLCTHDSLKLSTKIPTCDYSALGGESAQVPRAEIFHV